MSTTGTDHPHRLSITPHERRALEALTGFPLLAGIYGRRSRRFPKGAQIPSGALAWKSRQDPQPLSDLERALILATMTGVTGWHFGITHHPGYAPALPNYSGSASGRTFPSAAGFHTSQFFFTDDTGIYYLPTRDAPPDVPVVDGQVDLDAWLTATTDRYRRLSPQRLDLPRAEPFLEGHNTWIANLPGTLLVIPVADLAQHLLANLAFFAQNGFPIYDDIHGRPLPGIDAFGHLRHFDDPYPLSFVEQYTLTEASAELMTASYNGHLLLGAMGLGGWSFDGIDRLSVLGAAADQGVPGLGFTVQRDERWALANPTGLPGVFEGYCRPHYPGMAAAVRAYVDRKFGPGGPFHPDTPGPWTESAAVRASAAPHDAQFVDLLTLEATYIDETFGKFPGTVPTIQIMNYLQAQHLDTEYYDAKFAPGAYLSTHAQHQQVWH